MLEHSVLLAHRGSSTTLVEQLAELYPVLERLGGGFEVLVVDDGSSRGDRETLEDLARQYARMRLLWLDPASGASAALSAGIAASRGRHLIYIEAGRRYAAAEIPRMLNHLARADLVYGRRRGRRLRRWWRTFRSLPERMLLGLEVRDPGCRFWAARREAVEGLELGPGMERYLAWLVALRGFRVYEVAVRERRRAARRCASTPAVESRWGDLLSVWWQFRRTRNYTVTEVAPAKIVLEVVDDVDRFESDAA